MSTLPGGLEIWDRRRSGKPQLRSPISWGITGSGALDAAQVRNLFSMVSLISAPLFSAGRCVRKHQAEPQLRRPNLLGRLSQRSAGRCMSTSPSSLQECVPMHALLVMQGLGPLMHSLLHQSCPLCKQMLSSPFLLCAHFAFIQHEDQR